MRQRITDSKITSAILNTGFIGGTVFNIGGHVARAVSNNRYGYNAVISGYTILTISYIGICLRAYIRHGKLDQRYWTWFLLLAISPPLFIANQQSGKKAVSVAIVGILSAVTLIGTFTEIRYRRR